LILITGTLNLTKQHVVGRAFFRPIEVYGEIAPGLPDGTEITFRVGRFEVAASTINNNSYGIEEKIYFEMDDPNTPKIEGYSSGDTVSVYIEGVHIVDYSYFEVFKTRKDINLPASKRDEIVRRAERSAIDRGCTPKWECGLWGDCEDGIQTRVCTDIMRCGVDERKPAELRSCAPEVEVEQPLSAIFPWDMMLMFLLTLVVIAFFVNVLRRAKTIHHKKGSKKKR
jgi:hypothetical protein